jgi:hypothetical protein
MLGGAIRYNNAAWRSRANEVDAPTQLVRQFHWHCTLAFVNVVDAISASLDKFLATCPNIAPPPPKKKMLKFIYRLYRLLAVYIGLVQEHTEVFEPLCYYSCITWFINVKLLV